MAILEYDPADPASVHAALRSLRSCLPKQERWTLVTKEDLLQAAKDGIDATLLARRLGVSDANVYTAQRRHQVRLPDGRIRAGRPPGTGKVKRNATIVALLRSTGVTLQDAGRQFNISRERVRQIAKKAGITGAALREQRGPTPRQIEVADRKAQYVEQKRKIEAIHAAALEMRRRGASGPEVAAALGVGRRVVQWATEKAGFRVRRKRGKMPDAATLLSLTADGVTQREIAERYGVTQGGVCFALKRARGKRNA